MVLHLGVDYSLLILIGTGVMFFDSLKDGKMIEHKFHAEFHESHQDVRTSTVHGRPHSPAMRGGVGDSIESQVDYGVLQRERFVKALALLSRYIQLTYI